MTYCWVQIWSWFIICLYCRLSSWAFWIKLTTDWDWVWASENLLIILSVKLWKVLSDRHEDLESEFLSRVESESLSRITEFLSRIDRNFNNESILLWEIAHLTADQMITCKNKAQIRFLMKEMLFAALICSSVSNITVASFLSSSLFRHSLFKRININLTIMILNVLISFSFM